MRHVDDSEYRKYHTYRRIMKIYLRDKLNKKVYDRCGENNAIWSGTKLMIKRSIGHILRHDTQSRQGLKK